MPPEIKKSYSSGPVPKEAVDYFRAKGWKAGFSHLDVWREEHAHAFTVAKAMEVDVLESIRGAVDRAISEGRTFADFQKNLQPELEKLGWWGKKEQVDPLTGEKTLVQLGSPRRLKVIFRQNLRSAQAAGQWQRIERTKKTLPYLKYRIGPSEHHRKEHVAWDGLVLSADDPWWDTHFPPNGWGCKCWTQQLRRAPAGGAGKAPPIRNRKWQNPRTGEIERVPEGITPGFDFNPGKARTGEQLSRFKERLNAISPTAADAVQRAWMQPGIFGQWRKAPQGNIPVGVMDDDLMAATGAQRRTVLLSEDSMLKQDGATARSKGHPELTDEEYCLLPDLLAHGEVYKADDQRLIFFKRENVFYRAATKTTKDGRENYLLHFQQIPERNYKAAKKKFEQLREGD